MAKTLKIIAFIIASLTLGSCKNDKTTKTSPEASLSVFVSKPQIIEKQEIKTLEIGQKAPNFKLPGIDDKFHSLDEYTSDVLVILFSCNHCPTAQAYENRVIKFVDDYKNKSVQLVAISPNSPPGITLNELGYTDLNDSFDEMKIRAQDKGYNFPYLYDGDTQEASLKYGPVATPHVFVFDKARTLQYVGRLDAIEKPGEANAEDLRMAVDNLLIGKTPEVQITKTFGCSTKWGWKSENKNKVNTEWANRPVELSKINVNGLKELVKNEESNKLRLVNVWATWCGPCIMEYPDFVITYRMYKRRDFEFVSISADKPSQEDNVLEYLKSTSSAVSNYLFEADDKYALIEAIDPDWNGALPYSLLIEPNGNIVWKHQGEVDFHELRKFIVDHEMIGRYY